MTKCDSFVIVMLWDFGLIAVENEYKWIWENIYMLENHDKAFLIFYWTGSAQIMVCTGLLFGEPNQS